MMQGTSLRSLRFLGLNFTAEKSSNILTTNGGEGELNLKDGDKDRVVNKIVKSFFFRKKHYVLELLFLNHRTSARSGRRNTHLSRSSALDSSSRSSVSLGGGVDQFNIILGPASCHIDEFVYAPSTMDMKIAAKEKRTIVLNEKKIATKSHNLRGNGKYNKEEVKSSDTVTYNRDNEDVLSLLSTALKKSPRYKQYGVSEEEIEIPPRLTFPVAHSTAMLNTSDLSLGNVTEGASLIHGEDPKNIADDELQEWRNDALIHKATREESDEVTNIGPYMALHTPMSPFLQANSKDLAIAYDDGQQQQHTEERKMSYVHYSGFHCIIKERLDDYTVHEIGENGDTVPYGDNGSPDEMDKTSHNGDTSTDQNTMSSETSPPLLSSSNENKLYAALNHIVQALQPALRQAIINYYYSNKSVKVNGRDTMKECVALVKVPTGVMDKLTGISHPYRDNKEESDVSSSLFSYDHDRQVIVYILEAYLAAQAYATIDSAPVLSDKDKSEVRSATELIGIWRYSPVLDTLTTRCTIARDPSNAEITIIRLSVTPSVVMQQIKDIIGVRALQDIKRMLGYATAKDMEDAIAEISSEAESVIANRKLYKPYSNSSILSLTIPWIEERIIKVSTGDSIVYRSNHYEKSKTDPMLRHTFREKKSKALALLEDWLLSTTASSSSSVGAMMDHKTHELLSSYLITTRELNLIGDVNYFSVRLARRKRYITKNNEVINSSPSGSNSAKSDCNGENSDSMSPYKIDGINRTVLSLPDYIDVSVVEVTLEKRGLSHEYVVQELREDLEAIREDRYVDEMVAKVMALPSVYNTMSEEGEELSDEDRYMRARLAATERYMRHIRPLLPHIHFSVASPMESFSTSYQRLRIRGSRLEDIVCWINRNINSSVADVTSSTSKDSGPISTTFPKLSAQTISSPGKLTGTTLPKSLNLVHAATRSEVHPHIDPLQHLRVFRKARLTIDDISQNTKKVGLVGNRFKPHMMRHREHAGVRKFKVRLNAELTTTKDDDEFWKEHYYKLWNPSIVHARDIRLCPSSMSDEKQKVVVDSGENAKVIDNKRRMNHTNTTYKVIKKENSRGVKPPSSLSLNTLLLRAYDNVHAAEKDAMLYDMSPGRASPRNVHRSSSNSGASSTSSDASVKHPVNVHYRYKVVLRQIPPSEASRVRYCLMMTGGASTTKDPSTANKSQGTGFINYFAKHRFTKSTSRNVHVGLHLLKGEFKTAVAVITNGTDLSHDSINSGRTMLTPKERRERVIGDMRDGRAGRGICKKVMEGLSVLGDLARDEAGCEEIFRDYVGLMSCSSLVNEFLAVVWNELISERIRLLGRRAIVVGDIVRPRDSPSSSSTALSGEDNEICSLEMSHGSAHSRQPVFVTEEDIILERYSYKDVVMPIPGYYVILPDHEGLQHIYISTLKRYGIEVDPETSRWEIFGKGININAGSDPSFVNNEGDVSTSASNSNLALVPPNEMSAKQRNNSMLASLQEKWNVEVKESAKDNVISAATASTIVSHHSQRVGNALGLVVLGGYRYVYEDVTDFSFSEVVPDTETHEEEAKLADRLRAEAKLLRAKPSRNNKKELFKKKGHLPKINEVKSKKLENAAAGILKSLPRTVTLHFTLPSDVFPQMFLRELTKLDRNTWADVLRARKVLGKVDPHQHTREGTIDGEDSSLKSMKSKASPLNFNSLSAKDKKLYKNFIEKSRQTGKSKELQFATIFQKIFKGGYSPSTDLLSRSSFGRRSYGFSI